MSTTIEDLKLIKEGDTRTDRLLVDINLYGTHGAPWFVP